MSLGFIGSKVDYSLFVSQKSNIHLFFFIYVDDIIVTENRMLAITFLISSLKQTFAMKDLGPLSFFLGIHVHRNDVGAKLAKSPIPASTRLSQSNGDHLENAIEYHHLVGKL